MSTEAFAKAVFLTPEEAAVLGSHSRGIVGYVAFHDLSGGAKQEARAKYPYKSVGALYDFKDEHYYYPVDKTGHIFKGRGAQRVLAIRNAAMKDPAVMNKLGYTPSIKFHDKEILEGIPRGVWADYWALQQEEKGKSFSGQDIYELAPKTPTWAKVWGKKIADEIVRLNGRSLEGLYDMVKEAGYPRGKETFGYHLGMQAAGHGVSWSDDVRGLRHDAIKIPSHEFYR